MVANGYYPAIQNSLEGQTTAPISASDTTIPVDFCQYYVPKGWAYTDVSYANPVIVVISPDNADYTYPETVKITGIGAASGAGNLTVARAMGATTTAGYARAWGSGTKIAPILTAQHITQIQDGLAALSRDIVVGIKIDHSSSNPALTYVDIDKQPITLDSAYFNSSKIWGSIRRCVIDPATNEITYGSNGRGDGLDLTGASGDVMVEYMPFYWASERDGDDEYHWVSPYPYAGLPIHPWFPQRGGNVTPMYLGAYGASFALDGATPKLYSKTGVNPVTGEVGYTDLPGDSFTISDSETYANNKGTGWGSACWWSWHARMLLMYFDFGTRNLQTALGRGVVDLGPGTGFAGKENGADSADTNIGTNGTGTGTGLDGQTPVVWRGLADPYGNFWEFSTGWLAVDAGYQIVNRAGLSSAVMPAGVWGGADEYEQSVTAPITTTTGYISDYARDALLTGMFIPGTVAGSSTTYACDYFWTHNTGQTNIIMSGGYWDNGDYAGPGSLIANSVSSYSSRAIGARLEYKPQGV